MSTLLGTITHVDPLDNGARMGITFHVGSSRPLYLVADATDGNRATIAGVHAAVATADPVEIDIHPLPLRLGAPSGLVTAVRIPAQDLRPLALAA